jgi:hypothetical protein
MHCPSSDEFELYCTLQLDSINIVDFQVLISDCVKSRISYSANLPSLIKETKL